MRVDSRQKAVGKINCKLKIANCKIKTRKRLLFAVYFLLFTVHCSLLTVVTGCSDDPALLAYEKAEELFSQSAYTKAIANYSQIVNKYPESPYASASQYKVGLIYNLYLKNIKKAMNAYATLMLLYPDSKEVLLARSDMADIYMNKGDYRRAIGEYQWLTKNAGSSLRNNFQYQIGLAYLKLTDIKQARIEFQEIVKNFPDSTLAPHVYYQIANTYYLEANYKEAIKAYGWVISSYPNSPHSNESRLGKAVCMEETGNLVEAVELYKELEKSYPNPEIIKIRLDAIEAREKKNIPVVLKEK